MKIWLIPATFPLKYLPRVLHSARKWPWRGYLGIELLNVLCTSWQEDVIACSSKGN